MTVLLAALAVRIVWAGPPQTSTAPATSRPALDERPRLAVIGFESVPGSDERDTWIPVALEELLSRRLQRVPGLLVVPTIRLYQAQDELSEPNAPPPAWVDVVRGLGVQYALSGRCSGPDNALRVDLTLQRVDASGAEQHTSVGPERFDPVLDGITRWALARFELDQLPPALRAQLFAPPARSALAVEYYARALSAVRAQKPREALRYGVQSLEADTRFRPALMLVAQLEASLGPSGRDNATRRLRALFDLARMDDDAFDRVRAEIGQCLLLQLDGAFDAACTRAETALAVAYGGRDLYGQMAAIAALSELYLAQPMPGSPALSHAGQKAFAHASVARAAEWQRILLDMLDNLGDQLAGLPAANKLAQIYDQLDEPEQALEMHQRTLALATALHAQRHQATAWLFLGQWYRQQERWPEALDAVSRCLALADEKGKPAVRIALGQIYQAMQLPEKALAEFELGYEQVRKSDDLLNQFTCLREIADARMKLGQRDAALRALKEAIDIAHVLELRDEQRLQEQLDSWKASDN